MFSFCHNFCWLLGESFINCENLTDYCIRLSSPICYLAIYTMRICPEDLSSLNERLNGRHIRYFSGATARMLMMFIAWGER